MTAQGETENAKKKEEISRRDLIGRIEKFETGQNIEEYFEYLEDFFILNNVQDERFKINLLLKNIGTEMRQEITRFCMPRKPKDYTFEKIVSICKSINKGEPNILKLRNNFFKRNQRSDETLENFAIELKALANKCKFGNFRDEILRDKFISGIQSESVGEKLLNLRDKVDFEKVCKMAKSCECQQNSLKMHESKEIACIKRKSRLRVKRRGWNKSPKIENELGEIPIKNGTFESKERSLKKKRFVIKPTRDTKCYRCQGMGHFAWGCANKSHEKSIENKREIIDVLSKEKCDVKNK